MKNKNKYLKISPGSEQQTMPYEQNNQLIPPQHSYILWQENVYILCDCDYKFSSAEYIFEEHCF